MPVSLQRLDCYSNQLTSLPTLPASLQLLICYSNQLTSLPALPVGLTNLVCYVNQLTILPTLPASLADLRCDNNLLDFADLEAINPKPSIIYSATSQRYTILPATVSVATGGTLSINGIVGGTLNVYTWYKDGVVISGATSATYTKTGFVGADAGVYRCEVTSTFVGAGTTTGVTIYSSNVTVSFCPVLISNTTLVNGTVGTAYSQTLTQTGLIGTPTWSVSTGTLPTGLTIAPSTGVISGTPTIATSGSFTVSVGDGAGCTQTKVYSIAVACPLLVFGTTTASNGIVGAAYSVNAGVTGSTATVVYGISPALPPGLSFNTGTGAISGTPTVAASPNTYTVTATQGTCSVTQLYTFAVVCPALVFGTTTAGGATVGIAYSLNAGVTGNTATVAYGVSPALPAGLGISSSTGAISGTPTTPATSNTYTVTATQGTCSVTQLYTFAVVCPNIAFTLSIPANYDGVVGTAYTLNVVVTGNTSPLTYSVSPALPAGLSLNATTGVISGTPTTASTTTNYIVTASQNAGACSAIATYPIAITCPTIIFTNTTATSGVVNTAYSLNAGVTGNTATVLYSVNPALPAGLSLSAIGVISGTSTVPVASTTYTVTATQGTCIVTQIYTFAINCSGFSITPATLPNGTATVAYNQTLLTNLTGTLTWSVTPALPAGISLSSTGVIFGTTAVVSASTAYTVTVSNGVCSTPQTYNIAFVTPCTTVVLTPTLLALPNATFGTLYSQAITATGGTVDATYTFTTSTPLPSGLTFVNGVISGTPTFSTSVTFVVTATTASNCSGSRTYTLVILPNPTTALDNSLANQVKVSPNPSSGAFNIDFGSINMAKSSVRVYDAQGKTVYISENNSNLMVISLENFASGIYLLEVETSKGRILKRLAKN